ncbi:MAG: hypothetical protein CFE44_12430 [Burkholderiales bacterium PBB4]|nr:MAG: hypothetical protein CFE44_12430 [Burkholderiales bacterium PBB4]
MSALGPNPYRLSHGPSGPLWWATGLAALAAAASVGCAASARAPVKTDSPPPLPTAAADLVCARDGQGQPQTLALDQSCYALVRAADWFSPTPLRVQPGWVVKVSVPPGQRWYDADRVNIAPEGDEGNVVMRLFSGWKRHAQHPYFALMATVVNCAPVAGDKPGLRPCQQAEGSRAERVTRPTEVLSITAAGELAFYVNDAVLPWGWPSAFYGNNQGQIWVRLTMRRAAT